MFGYFLLGHAFCKTLFFEKLINRIDKKFSLLLIVIFIILSVTLVDYNIDVHNNVIGNQFSFICLSLYAIISIPLFCMNYNIGKYMSFLGINTLIIFIFHGRAFFIVQNIFELSHVNVLVEYRCIYSLLFVFLAGLLLLALSMIINKYLPWIVGKKKMIK